jgi:hypothetical protein
MRGASSNTAKMVAYLCEGFPVSAVATILETDRASIYAWLDGSEPSQQSAKRINNLYDSLKNTNLKTLYRVMNRRLSSDQTIGQLLTSDSIDAEGIAKALEELAPAMAKHAERDAARKAPPPGARNPLIDEMPEACLDIDDAQP